MRSKRLRSGEGNRGGRGRFAFTGKIAGPPYAAVAYDPPCVRSLSDQDQAGPAQGGRRQVLQFGPYNVQEEPARKLKNCRIALFASTPPKRPSFTPNPGAKFCLPEAGGSSRRGNPAGGSRHSRERPLFSGRKGCPPPKLILNWLDKNVNMKASPAKHSPKKGDDSTAMKLADFFFFRVGAEEKKIAPLSRRGKRSCTEAAAETASLPGGAGPWLARDKARITWVSAATPGCRPATTLISSIASATAAPFITPRSRRPGVQLRQHLFPLTRAVVEPNRRWAGTGDVGDSCSSISSRRGRRTATDKSPRRSCGARAGGQLLDKKGPAIITYGALRGGARSAGWSRMSVPEW